MAAKQRGEELLLEREHLSQEVHDLQGKLKSTELTVQQQLSLRQREKENMLKLRRTREQERLAQEERYKAELAAVQQKAALLEQEKEAANARAAL